MAGVAALDLAAAVAEAANVGFAVVTGGVRAADRAELLSELDTIQFVPLEPMIGNVRQQGDVCMLDVDKLESTSGIAGFAAALSGAVQASGVVGTDGYRPTEVMAQRYTAAGCGVTAHRDQRRYVGVIAIATLEGEATFRVLDSIKRQRETATWTAKPGDLVLLAASDLADEEDRRPVHSVEGPASGQRTSITFRHNRLGALVFDD